jgi:hypothetical protein
MCENCGDIPIRPAASARAGWTEQFRAMAEHGDDRLLDDTTLTVWDEIEWQWDSDDSTSVELASLPS